MKTYIHLPTPVEAIPVQRPHHNITRAIPRSRIFKKSGGAFDYVLLYDAPDGDNRAYDGDWIVKYPTGCVARKTDDEFQRYYTTQDEYEAVVRALLVDPEELEEVGGDSADPADD